MKHIRTWLALALALCLVLSLLPAVPAEAATELQADSGEACTVVLTGNTGAVLDCDFIPLSAEVDDNSLAIVEIRGNTVRVIGKEGAVGVARLTVEGSAGYQIFDIPIGYTTFVFDGGRLTVLEGSDLNYQVTGINAAAEEYIVGAAVNPLPETLNPDGSKTYENTDTYKLSVNIAKTGGTYVFTGRAADASIAVKKAATDPAVLLLAGLELTSSFTAPIAVKKESASTATITALAGFDNTLTDAAFNNADLYGDPTEDGGDGTNIEYAESAVIKGKSYANLTLNGAGTLNLICNTKNALKVGEYGSLTIDELRLNITSVKNGVSSDNTLTVNGGDLHVTTADGDCIRSDPDAVNAAAGCAGCITINGGSFTLQSGSDGIQAAQDLTVNGGSFQITTGSGYNDSSFNKDTMSCKGLKASCNAVDASGAETDATNHITINGGSFVLNTADDAIHSDAYVNINGGTFTIRTGDDGVHGDSDVVFGAQGGADCAIHLTVTNSYEALEGATVTFLSGCYDVTASDDGVNAAGGSSNGSDPGPGGGWWGPGGGGSSGTYHLYVKGGRLNVNANGDGLDANGNLELTGGQVIVWGQQANGDNAPLDCDGSLLINGATVFAAGSRQMATNPGSGSQAYVRYGSSGGGWGGGSSSSIAAGKTVVVKNASSQTAFSIKAVKSVNYALYSAPTMTSSSGWSITSDSSTPTTEKFWTGHTWGAYARTKAPTCTVPGVETSACTLCGETQTREIPASGHTWSSVTVEPTATEEGYDLYTCSVCGGQYRTNFTDPTGDTDPCIDGHTWDGGTVTVQPTCTESGVTTYTCTVCGETMTTDSPSALGHSFDETSGHCIRCDEEALKATFVCSEGVTVTAFPSQDLTTGGVENAGTVFIRNSAGLIDISGSGQVNFMVVLAEGYDVESIEVTPAGSYNAIKYPSDIGTENAYRITKVNQDITVAVTASTTVCSHEFDENGFCIHCGLEAPKAVFTCGEHCSVTVYPTQDLTAGGTPNATVALARNSDTGEVDINGNGQVNFVLHIDEGYELDSLTAEPTSAYKNFKDNGDGSYRLTKVSGTVAVTASVREIHSTPAWEACDGAELCPGKSFVDMPAFGTWSHMPIDWALTAGITTGTSDTTFSPKRACTRAQVVTFLWRAAGSPEPGSTENPFSDVGDGVYYRTAVLWAVEQGITTGTSTNTFTPNGSCSRAAFVTFLWRYMGCPAPTTAENPFADVPAGKYYTDAVLWAVEHGITNGTSATAFSPNKTCSREQVVTFLFRAIVGA